METLSAEDQPQRTAPALSEGRNNHTRDDGADSSMTKDGDEELEKEQALISVLQDKKVEEQQYNRPPNPMLQASWVSRLFFLWPYPLLQLGRLRPLEDRDLPEIIDVDSSQVNYEAFQRLWQAELSDDGDNAPPPNLHRALLMDYIKSIWYIQPMIGLASIAKVIQAIALGYLIESFETTTSTTEKNIRNGYVWSAVLIGCGMVILFEHHHVFFSTWRKGMQVRISCVASIFEKSLRLSSTSNKKQTTSTGKVMNLASNDVERFIYCALFLSYAFWSPLQSLGILAVGWWTVGPAFGAGFATLVFLYVPFQYKLARLFSQYRSRIAAATDERVTFVGQAIYGARVMKMSGTEMRFQDRIHGLRQKEVAEIGRSNTLKAWNEALFFTCNLVVSIVTFLVHVLLLDGTLTPRDVFTVYTLVNVLQLEMTKHLSLAVMGGSEAYVSITRIQEFLLAPELEHQPDVDPHLQIESATKDNNEINVKSEDDETNTKDGDETNVCLSMIDVTCYWNCQSDIVENDDMNDTQHSESSRNPVAVQDTTIEFRRGELTCILGMVGSGKSALVQAIVGELTVHAGSIRRRHSSMSYAPQDPWIMDGTVRENILMGHPWDEAWYHQVVDACGLRLDFQQLLNSDLTIVGDRGVQCSGGQRARIGLARALYRDADLIVVDDPLSAVDSKVGRVIFQEALQKLSVERGKCVILSTHQHQYVNKHRCAVVIGGKIDTIGTYQECVDAAGGRLIASEKDASVDSLVESALEKSTNNEARQTAINTSETSDDNVQEIKETGLVRRKTVMKYIQAIGGWHITFFLVMLYVATTACSLSTVVVIGRWAERPSELQKDGDILGLVVGLGFVVIVLASANTMLTYRVLVKASQRLHDSMTTAMLRAKISFFDTNPLGRILNRFSADVGSNDDMLPPTLSDFFTIFFVVVGAVTTAMIVLPFALVAVPPLLWYFLSVRNIFVTSTRELKRLEGLARSPIFAMLGESLSGIAVIRANSAKEYFSQKFRKLHDSHTRSVFQFIAASRWVGFRMDSIMFSLLALVSMLCVTFHQQGWFEVDPAIFGLALSLLLQMAGIFQWCVRQSAEVVNLMVSVERVTAYGEEEPEAALVEETDSELTDDWPSRGEVTFQNLSVKYRPSLPLALNKVSFHIPGGSRVGVVGRTGSGKSSLVQTLFRLLEAESGTIHIDGVDISKVGLHRLRTRISVIPQVPTLFSGCSIRENVDLFSIHSDKEIELAIAAAHLAEVVAELPDGVSSLVSEGGSNFSSGQRQLLCLARAILSKNKILVLDEATASVDQKTDQMLHESLHESFHDATIIAVAHRLDTVIEHDLILVLGDGQVLEFGTPADLLRSGGSFQQMVEDTGDLSSQLKQRAAEKEARDIKKAEADTTS